jgi:putative endonuclease
MERNGASASRQKAERRGRRSEWYAALWLMLKGYRILALRYRTPVGEVDIIARRGNLVAFVEVKARSTERAAVDAVSDAAHRRIRAAGELWLAREPKAAQLSLRFDIVAVMPRRLPRHIPGAF